MSKSFDVAVAFMQLFLLVLWEAVGVFYFDWEPLAIFLCWLVGIWTLNIATATVLRTFIKLASPTTVVGDNVVDIADAREER